MLQLRWGAKHDERTATLIVNGKSVALASGGYDGFRWLDVPLPAGVTGDRYALELQLTVRE